MNSQEALTKAWNVHQAGDLSGAERVYRQVIAAEPNNAAAWCFLGIALYDLQRYEEAEVAYRKSLVLNPQMTEAYNNLGNALRSLDRIPEALSMFDIALKLRPDYANAYRNKASAIYWSGDLEGSVKFFEQSIALKGDDPEAHLNLGIALLLKGDFDRGWNEYSSRLQTKGNAPPRFAQPLWEGGSLEGKTILLTSEQGFGDTIQFLRYGMRLKELYDCRVIAAIHEKLIPFLSSVPGIDELHPAGSPPSQFDCFAPLLELPRLLRDDFRERTWKQPYVEVDQKLVALWKERLAEYAGLKVGLVWQGNPKHSADVARSIPLRDFAALSRLSGVTFFSLQQGFGSEQLEELGGRFPIVPLGPKLDANTGAFVETAAVMKNLDLVLTIDSAAAHVAGAIDVPVWTALSFVPDWRWQLERSDTPWYRSMRLFRRNVGERWSSLIERMTAALVETYPGVRFKTAEEFRLASSGMNRLVAARHGLLLYDRTDRMMGQSIEAYGEVLERDLDLVRQFVRPGAWVVECDASLGAHTLAISELVGKLGQVFAYEPHPPTFQMLCANLALNSRTNVAARCETLGPADRTAQAAGPNPSVTERTLDSLRLPRLDVLKTNLPGRELRIIQGAQETLKKQRPILLLAVERTTNLIELISLLETLEYDLYWHQSQVYQADNFFGTQTDYFPKTESMRVLGVPRSLPSRIEGLPRITRDSIVMENSSRA